MLLDTFLDELDESDNDIKKEIMKIFEKNLKGKKYVKNSNYCGSEGIFVEKSFGILTNGNNVPDYKGFEFKKICNKITFGDWSACEYIFKQSYTLKKINKMKYFGSYNIDKKRYSWSGKCMPKYGIWNNNGLTLKFDKNNNLYVVYSNSKDKRNIYMPSLFTSRRFVVLAYWKADVLKNKIENKFNKRGFVLFCKNKKKEYNEIKFGKII